MCTMESINIFSMQMQMISLEWQYWLFLDWIQCDWACWLVRSNTSRTNYLQISPSLGQIYLQGKIFSNLVYLIKYQSRVGVTGRAQCHVTTAESAAPGMEAIFDRKCPPYSQTTLISSHIQYDVHILVLFGCVSPRMEIWQTHLNIARLLPSQPCSSLWWQGQWIVSRLRLMEHGWRGRSCNQALRWKEALVLGGKPSRQMWARGSVWMQLMRIYIKYFGSLPTVDAWLAVLGIGRIHQIQIHQIQVGQLTHTQLHTSWALCCQPNKS